MERVDGSGPSGNRPNRANWLSCLGLARALHGHEGWLLRRPAGTRNAALSPGGLLLPALIPLQTLRCFFPSPGFPSDSAFPIERAFRCILAATTGIWCPVSRPAPNGA